MMREINLIVVHGSATFITMNIGVEEIREWHLARGWDDIGYHDVIRRDGVIEIGRPLEIPGAHARGFNSKSIGVCLIGGLSIDRKPEFNYTWRQMSTLRNYCEDRQVQFNQPEIVGHNDLTPYKACPSFNVKAWRDSA